MLYGLWQDPLYRQTALILVGFLLTLGLVIFLLSKHGPLMNSAWASLKSWIFVIPFVFAILALPKPWPLVFMVLLSLQSAKTFFQMVGAYHRSWFVWTTYIFIILQGYIIYHPPLGYLYDLTPMIFLGTVSLIPVLRNTALHMIQYMALSTICFVFFGWSLLHMARFTSLDGGILILIYLFMLTEFSENVCWAVSRTFGKMKLFSKISNKVTLEGFLVSLVLTLLLAWGMRHLLPVRSNKYWLAAGLFAAIFGRFGDLILSVIRRDLGIKNTGIFIFGRDDILARMDKLIFVGPLYYYLFLYFQKG
jgi:phosphatidate cytidylyltransferase